MKIPSLAKKWIEFLMKNPRKAKGMLDKGGGRRCCLGHLCYLDNDLKREKDKEGFFSYFEGDGFHYPTTKNTAELPKSTCSKVDLRPCGEFNEKGVGIAAEFLKKNNIKSSTTCYGLTSINDVTKISHAKMGELIELLYKKKGFVTYD